MKDFDQFVEIVTKLRSETGCPWDRSQTPDSMRPYILEETYEVLEAIDTGDSDGLAKELGDLLFQILLLTQIASENGEFDIQTVIQKISDKMVRRHPHVFDPNYVASDQEGTIQAWESRKARERDKSASALQGVPKSLPALLRAYRVTEKAARVGFDWPDLSGVRKKLDEEVAEFDDACREGDTKNIEHEYGDLLFTLVNMSRFLPVTPEEALRKATLRFERRFRHVEEQLQESGESIHDAQLDRLEVLWTQAKADTCS